MIYNKKFLILIIIIITSIIYNLQNNYFIDYITETKNYFLLCLPLTHTYLYNTDNVKIGFVSKLLGFVIIAVYTEPKYRYKNHIKKYFQNNKSKIILTNNKAICKKLIEYKYKNIIDIPFIRLYYM